VPPRRKGLGPILAATLAGFAVAGLVLVLAGGGGGSSPRATLAPVPPPSTTGPHGAADAQALVDAWQRSRTGTWVVEAHYTLQRGGAVVSEGEQATAQRPPDRLVRQFGSTQGTVAGRAVACATGPDDRLACRDGGPAPDYGQDVAREVANLAALVQGQGAAYAVAAQEGGCYALDLLRTLSQPPYGRHARFCFDPATGAPVRQEVDHEGEVELTVATDVRAPTDADFALPTPAG
jgi:hypothetical protein